jgi:hypothetical protein
MKESEKDGVLKRFMQEFFPYKEMKRNGIWGKEMRNDYKAQAKWVCDHFGYETVYQYGAEETRCHISYSGERPPDEPFVTVIPSIYE